MPLTFDLTALPAYSEIMGEKTEPTVDTAGQDPLSSTQDYLQSTDDYLYQRASDAEVVANEEKARLVKDEDFMANLRYYMRSRFNDDGKQNADESDEAFYDRFMTHYRWATNNSFSLLKEIDFQRGTDTPTREAFGRVYEKVERDAPTLFDMSAGEAANALGDYVYASATDPLGLAQTVIGGVVTGGTGAVASLTAKQFASRAALKKALTTTILGKNVSKHVLRGTAAHGAVGAATGALQDAMLQELEQRAYIGTDEEGNAVFDPTISYEDRATDINRVLESAALGGVLGLGEGVLIGKAAKKGAVSYANERIKILGLQGKLNSKLDLLDNENRIVDAITFDPVQGDQTNSLLRAVDLTTPEGKKFEGVLGKLRDNLNATAKDDPIQAAIDQVDVDAVGTVANSDALTQAQLRVQVVRNLDKFATGLYKVKVEDFEAAAKMGVKLEDDALFNLIEGLKDDQATDITRELWSYVVKDAKEGDWDAVERALESANLTKTDFLDILERVDAEGPDGEKVMVAIQRAFRQSKSDAGRVLSSGSALGKARKAFFSMDKKDVDKVNKLFGAGDPTTQAYTNLIEFFQRAGRVRRGLMVINPATTMRNIFSGMANVTFSTASNTIESVIYNMGKAVTGKQSVGKSLNEIWLDSSNLLLSLIQPSTTVGAVTGNLSITKAKALADAAVVNNPTLARRLFRSNNNFDGDGSLPGFVTFLNGLNIAQDAFFRRGLFAYELDKKFRRAGIEGGLEGVLKDNTHIPTDILQAAAAETMKGTFSYAPRRNKGSLESIAAVTLDFIEKVPMGTVALPFARFMMNALAFQFKYSPLNVASNAYDAAFVAATKGRKEVNLPKLAESFANSSVGMAALMAALKVRSENQDQPYYNMRVGDTIIDTRALFPITPYLMLADFLYKMEALGPEQFNRQIDPDRIDRAPPNIRELAEGIAGVNLRSSAQLPLFDAMLNIASGDFTKEEKPFEAFGKMVGEYANSFLVGTNFVKDVIASFDSQEAAIRDYNAAIEGTGGMERGLSAFTQTVKKSLPVGVQGLAGLAEPPTRAYAYRGPNEVAYRENTLAKQTIGVTTVRKPTDVETEMRFLGQEEWVAFRTTGDKLVDNYIREGASQFASGVIQTLMSNDAYKDMAYESKKVLVNDLLSKIRKEAKVMGEVFSQRDMAAKYDLVKTGIENEISAIIKKDGDITDANENEVSTLERKRLLYKNYSYTGPFARFRWLKADNRTKAAVNKQLEELRFTVAEKADRGEKLADYEKLLLLAPRPTVESSGLYGLGYELSKLIEKSYSF